MMIINKKSYLCGDMSKWIAKLNSRYEGAEFFEKLAQAAEDDRTIHTAMIDGETVFVTGYHLAEKSIARAGRTRHVIESHIAELLRNPIVMAYLRQYPVYLDNSTPAGKVVGMESTDGVVVNAVALVDEAEHLIYILETGWDYCYLHTILNYSHGGHSYYRGNSDDGRVSLHCDTVPVSVTKSGFVRFGDTDMVYRMSQEQERRMNAKRSRAHN